jgi:hypothetical protein
MPTTGNTSSEATSKWSAAPYSDAMIDAEATASRSLRYIAHVCFFERAKLYWLTLASCFMLFISIYLMLSPGVAYSRKMTWDFLYNLEGAWRLYNGQVLHVDFHDALGTLPFALTVFGFQLVGAKPIAFVIGECVLAILLTILAIIAVKDRLPFLPALLFVSICAMLVVVPLNVGDDLPEFTFAMGHNRFGWSALSILCLLLFIEPRGGRYTVWEDLIAGNILTIGLFYTKITYFGVALAAITLALLTSGHIRRHWLAWCATLLVAVLIAFAPISDGYRADIISGISSGRVRWHPVGLIFAFVHDSIEQSWVLAEILFLLYLWRERCAKLGDVFAGLFIWTAGFFILTQNTQVRNIPLYAVLTLLVYVRLGVWVRAAKPQSLISAACLMSCALFPLLQPLSSNVLGLLAYNIKASPGPGAFVVKETNLQGLAVPADHDKITDGYINTILSLADLLREKGAPAARIVVIDQVNPLPFVLGAEAPRGGNLWSRGDIAWRAPEDVFREADYVAIPRFPTVRETLIEELEIYRDYLSAHFVRRYETPYWTLLERQNTMSLEGIQPGVYSRDCRGSVCRGTLAGKGGCLDRCCA